MTVHIVREAPSAELAKALADFEERFRYPLGPGRTFRISHGSDYPLFFRSMGDAACFVAEREGRILGVLGAALRRLCLPGGGERLALYLGDAKVDAAARGGRTLLRLIEAARTWVGSRTEAAFSIVMQGTATMPEHYSGRVGIPLFEELGRISVLRLAVSGVPSAADRAWATGTERVIEACAARRTEGYFCADADAAARSEAVPLRLSDPSGRACGRLEDTRRAKLLIADDGVVMRDAHLSNLAYEAPQDGARLLRVAARFAAERGAQGLFVAVPANEADGLRGELGTTETIAASATIFGTGIQSGHPWWINTAEI